MLNKYIKMPLKAPKNTIKNKCIHLFMLKKMFIYLIHSFIRFNNKKKKTEKHHPSSVSCLIFSDSNSDPYWWSFTSIMNKWQTKGNEHFFLSFFSFAPKCYSWRSDKSITKTVAGAAGLLVILIRNDQCLY